MRCLIRLVSQKLRPTAGSVVVASQRRMFSLGPSAGGPWWRPRPPHGPHHRRHAASGAAAQRGSYWQRVQGWQGPLRSAAISGSMSALGDLLAQALTQHHAKRSSKAPAAFDPVRAARMFGFGFCWYGPYQFYWYNLLDHLMPARNTANFVCKVAANQLLLAPVVLAVVFSWNLGWTGQLADLGHKLQRDLLPSMMNGWKFWVPAASINFYAVPLQQQVLYMSCCGVLWTAYLSYASTVAVGQERSSSGGGGGGGKACCSSKR